MDQDDQDGADDEGDLPEDDEIRLLVEDALEESIRLTAALRIIHARLGGFGDGAPQPEGT
jgi:hypothetical protein